MTKEEARSILAYRSYQQLTNLLSNGLDPKYIEAFVNAPSRHAFIFEYYNNGKAREYVLEYFKIKPIIRSYDIIILANMICQLHLKYTFNGNAPLMKKHIYWKHRVNINSSGDIYVLYKQWNLHAIVKSEVELIVVGKKRHEPFYKLGNPNPLGFEIEGKQPAKEGTIYGTKIENKNRH